MVTTQRQFHLQSHTPITSNLAETNDITNIQRKNCNIWVKFRRDGDVGTLKLEHTGQQNSSTQYSKSAVFNLGYTKTSYWVHKIEKEIVSDKH
jgi:hypothetical protein